MKTFYVVAGARPNFVKVAAIWKAYLELMRKSPKPALELCLVNTGQHYDYRMAQSFFKELMLPDPFANLNVGSASHAVQTAKIMESFEKVILKRRPDLVIVVGDVNSTMACALVAVKMGIPVAHVESGLRSRDRSMPEEINRLVTDSISDILFTTSTDADRNLRSEGIAKGKIHFVGNVMVDTLLHNRSKAKGSKILSRLALRRPYAVLTLHRPSNVDSSADFLEILKAVADLQEHLPVIFPVHPRTAAKMKQGNLKEVLKRMPALKIVPPLGYLDFIKLLSQARIVLTDSGGIQEETTVLNIPCLTLRDNTERPVTLRSGSNILAGRKSERIIRLARRILSSDNRQEPQRVPDYWDGKAAIRIFKVLREIYRF